jgi:hypothetical protein
MDATSYGLAFIVAPRACVCTKGGEYGLSVSGWEGIYGAVGDSWLYSCFSLSRLLYFHWTGK